MNISDSNEDKCVFQILDPIRIRNFAKKVEPLCEQMRWSRKSRPWGINVEFDSLSYGKTYMIIFQVVLRKKFYCCYFF